MPGSRNCIRGKFKQPMSAIGMIGARDVGGETVNDPDSGQEGCAKFKWCFVCSAAGEGAPCAIHSLHVCMKEINASKHGSLKNNKPTPGFNHLRV